MHPTRYCTFIPFTLNKSFLQHGYIHKNSQAPNHPQKKNGVTPGTSKCCHVGSSQIGDGSHVASPKTPAAIVPGAITPSRPFIPSLVPTSVKLKIICSKPLTPKKMEEKNIDVE